MTLQEKIQKRTATIGIIGLGLPGISLAIRFVKAGFKTIGFDDAGSKEKYLRRYASCLRRIPAEDILMLKGNKDFRTTADLTRLKLADCVILCEAAQHPGNYGMHGSSALASAKSVVRHLRTGQLILLESSVFPGTTERDIRQILEISGLRAGKDFSLAFSPAGKDGERMMPASSRRRIIGGYTKDCLAAADELYTAVQEKTVPVSSTRVAEAARLLESIRCAVNIAMMNEITALFKHMEIDMAEVLRATAGHPTGRRAYDPGNRAGDGAVSSDSLHLIQRARDYDLPMRFIELAGEINARMPQNHAAIVSHALKEKGKLVEQSAILVLGPPDKDGRGVPGEFSPPRLIELLQEQGARVDRHDPIPRNGNRSPRNCGTASLITPENLGRYDCVVIATDYDGYDYPFIMKHASLVVDTRNAVKTAARNGNLVKA